MKNLIAVFLFLLIAACQPNTESVSESTSFALSFAEELSDEALDGRLLLILSKDDEDEPRFQVRPGVNAVQMFGMNVENMSPGEDIILDGSVFGYPYDSLDAVPPGEYFVQAVLHKYDAFNLSCQWIRAKVSDGHHHPAIFTVSLVLFRLIRQQAQFRL